MAGNKHVEIKTDRTEKSSGKWINENTEIYSVGLTDSSSKLTALQYCRDAVLNECSITLLPFSRVPFLHQCS
jgi:hypothetical protein